MWETQKGRTYPPDLLNFCKLSLVTTCPHSIIIGGFCSVDCSLETGQANIEWYRFSAGNGISIYENENLSRVKRNRENSITGSSSV